MCNGQFSNIFFKKLSSFQRVYSFKLVSSFNQPANVKMRRTFSFLLNLRKITTKQTISQTLTPFVLVRQHNNAPSIRLLLPPPPNSSAPPWSSSGVLWGSGPAVILTIASAAATTKCDDDDDDDDDDDGLDVEELRVAGRKDTRVRTGRKDNRKKRQRLDVAESDEKKMAKKVRQSV